MDVLVGGEILLYGTVGEDLWGDGFTPTDVARALAELGRDADVNVRINSGGGYVSDGITIFNSLKAHRGKVTVYVDGYALSAASVIAMAGAEVVMRTGSVMMVHDPATITIGGIVEHDLAVISLEAQAASIADIYGEKTGKGIDVTRAEMRAETWMSAEQAITAGYADRLDAANANEPTAFGYRHYQNAPDRAVALADARAWAKRTSPTAAAATPNGQKDSPMATLPAGGGAATREPASSTPPGGAEIVNIDQARAAGRTDALAYVREVHEICGLAGCPEKATAFIGKDAKPADIRRELIEARASADGARKVSGHILPNAGSDSTAMRVDIVADAKRRHGGR